MDKNPAKFLDAILDFLSSDYNGMFTVVEVKNHIYRKELNKISKSTKSEDFFSDKYFETNIINAIMFLNREGLVAYNEKERTAFINTKGFVKIRTEGYHKEIRNKKVNLWLQRITWISATITLLITIYIQFIKTDFSTKSLNCNCKPSTTEVHHKSKNVPLLKEQ